MSYDEKLLNFAYKLYSKLGESEIIQEACKDQEQDMVVELRIKDAPEAIWQIGSKNHKWFVNKGAKEKCNAAIEYLKVKYVNDWWSGRMDAAAMFSQGGMQIVEGDMGDLAFMAPVEEPLKEAYQEMKGEFPGLPP